MEYMLKVHGVHGAEAEIARLRDIEAKAMEDVRKMREDLKK